jgi:class 3 adenylate cyclase
MNGVSGPSGTVTFLFTDIEGSTRRWEADPEAMRLALAVHDEVIRAAIDAHSRWLFKHTGDGVCAAFGSARTASDAAVDAQHRLGLPARMGIATGEAECRGDDYFGQVLNRAARVMAAGHGGQILVAASTAGVLSVVEFLDRGGASAAGPVRCRAPVPGGRRRVASPVSAVADAGCGAGEPACAANESRGPRQRGERSVRPGADIGW